VAHGVAAGLDPAVLAVGRGVGLERARRRVGEEGLHLPEGGGPVALERQEVVAAARQDGRGDGALRADRVDRDQGTRERQALQEPRDGGDLVRLAGDRLLPEHEALPSRPRGDQVQRRAALAAGVGAPRGLAVDRDEVGRRLAQALDPAREARLEQLGVEGGDHLAQRVVARDAVPVGQEAAQERQVLLAPHLDLDEVVRPRQGSAQQEQQDLRQAVEHLGRLARVLQDGEVVEQGGAGGPVHGRLHRWARPETRPRSALKLTSRSSDCPGPGPGRS
jgi:hypothetical protein